MPGVGSPTRGDGTDSRVPVISLMESYSVPKFTVAWDPGVSRCLLDFLLIFVKIPLGAQGLCYYLLGIPKDP